MKKISLWVLLLVCTASPSLVRAQESAAQQEIDKLSGQIQDMQESQLRLGQRLDALEKQMADLSDKVNAPVVQKDFANRDDLKKLAEQVQEIDRKRQDDRELILKQIEALGKAAAMAPMPTPPSHHEHFSAPKPTPSTSSSEDTTSSAAPSTPATPEKGYEYVVKDGDNLGLIIKAYKAQGVKVTKRQIIAANPKINPDVLIPGKKIFIPDPSAK
jgi:nucleoid-associated protein YgaU